MTLRILIDLLFYTGQRGGTETYARQIVRRLPDALPDAQLFAITGRAGASAVREFFPGEVHTVPWVGADRVSWAAGALGATDAWSRRLRCDVVWCPANFAPVRPSSTPRVTTTHDVIYHTLKGAGPTRVVGGVTSWLMSKAALSSDTIITGSEAAKAAITTHIGVPAAKITVIPHGTAAPQRHDDADLTELGVPSDRPIVLSTGNRLPHKNFEGLLRALSALPAPRPLAVIPGSHGQDPLAGLVEELGLQGDVLLPGWVTLPQLETLYARASLYVCPSLSEGFGLPVIDAMRRGCLVLANDVPVLREVGDEVARYSDASSPVEFAAAIASALRDDDPARREAGRRRAALFTWERSAERTAEVLRRTARSLQRV